MNFDAGKILLVYGPPGTGKTTHLSRRIETAAERYGADNVMVSSLTVAAAREIAGRRLPLPKGSVGTLHSFCFHALGRPKIAEAEAKSWNEYCPAFALTGGSDLAEAAVEANYSGEGDRLSAEYQRLRARMIDQEVWPKEVVAFASTWSTWKNENGYLDFTDLLDRALEDVPTAPGDPRVGFFDEFQDFSALAVSLVRKWAASMDFAMLAGDDDQCLYEFSGASPRLMLDLDREVPPKFVSVLDQSYRVPGAVKDFAERLIGRVSRRKEKVYRAVANRPGEVSSLAANFQDPRPLLPLIKNAETFDQSIMFLASCAYMLQPLVAMLRAEGIPYHNPYRPTRWNPLAKRGAVDRLLSYLKPTTREADDDGLWDSTGEIDDWLEPMKAAGLFLTGKKSTLGERAADFFLSRPESLDYLRGLLTPPAVEHLGERENLTLQWFVEHLTSSKRPSYDFPAAIYRRSGAAGLARKPNVIVGTIHSVKGGEADNVVLFPDLSRVGYANWLRGGDDSDAVIRMFYVGATRAKQSLFICRPAERYHVGLSA